jgi:hypothetical protein
MYALPVLPYGTVLHLRAVAVHACHSTVRVLPTLAVSVQHHPQPLIVADVHQPLAAQLQRQRPAVVGKVLCGAILQWHVAPQQLPRRPLVGGLLQVASVRVAPSLIRRQVTLVVVDKRSCGACMAVY